MPRLPVSSFNCGTSVNLVQNKECVDTWFWGIRKGCYACHPKIIIRIRIIVVIIKITYNNVYILIYSIVFISVCVVEVMFFNVLTYLSGSVLQGDFNTTTWPAAKWRCVAGAVAGKKAMPWMARSFHGNRQEVIKSTAMLVKCISEDLSLQPHAGAS